VKRLAERTLNALFSEAKRREYMISEKIILLGQGERDLAAALNGALKKNGYKVDVVFDGAQAVNALNNGGYDLLIVGDALSRVTAKEVIEKFRALSKSPVLIITDRRAIKSDEKEWEGVQTLNMPFTEQRFIDKVGNLLNLTDN